MGIEIFYRQRRLHLLSVWGRYLSWVLAFAVLGGGLGCHKLRPVSRGPAGAEVRRQDYPISTYAYQMSLVFHTTPHDLMENFVRNLSWVERISGPMKLELKQLAPNTDMTVAGQFLDFNIKILGINIPCRLICLKSKPDQELWWMIIPPGDSWILFHYEMKPVSEGCKLILKVQGGQPPKYLEAMAGLHSLIEAVAARLDLALTLIQADFDPSLDVEQVTGHGLRGELYENFLQGNESAIWVDAPPPKVVRWIFSDPENLNFMIPNLRFKGPCFEDPRILFAHAEELIACPSSYDLAGVDMKAMVLSKGGWEDENQLTSYHHNIWIVALDHLFRVQILVTAQGSGSEVKVVFATELSESAGAEAIEFLITLAGIPERCERALLKIKAGVEGSEF